MKVRDAKLENMGSVINGFSWVGINEDPHSVNIPKVITTENNQLVYMSRVALPGYKDTKEAPARYKKNKYVFMLLQKKELQDFHDFGRKSELEKYEDIEILRFF